MEVERMLGVYISPNLNQQEQFKKMIEKLNSAIYKLKQKVIELGVIYFYFNVYLLKSVFFGCGIVNLSIKQDDIL